MYGCQSKTNIVAGRVIVATNSSSSQSHPATTSTEWNRCMLCLAIARAISKTTLHEDYCSKINGGGSIHGLSWKYRVFPPNSLHMTVGGTKWPSNDDDSKVMRGTCGTKHTDVTQGTNQEQQLIGYASEDRTTRRRNYPEQWKAGEMGAKTMDTVDSVRRSSGRA
ncbi:hypothetical protein BKA67DRAFT_537304 [Truncatella angustata]|uniref:Uncharacterized protein n=1 Tax=Truncatella angustata TaxID=152316 RepID=A0A9P8ZY52_9PEZI|nr:uncharacterized protein BKA67DRAFT_537304 [Truncatella angustata]KAH6653688.1 hypothetical protein BKA67DRAFT_537304 [Truncatella angustata]